MQGGLPPTGRKAYHLRLPRRRSMFSRDLAMESVLIGRIQSSVRGRWPERKLGVWDSSTRKTSADSGQCINADSMNVMSGTLLLPARDLPQLMKPKTAEAVTRHPSPFTLHNQYFSTPAGFPVIVDEHRRTLLSAIGAYQAARSNSVG